MHKTKSGRWQPDRPVPPELDRPEPPIPSEAEIQSRIMMLACRGALELPNSPWAAFEQIEMSHAG